MSAFAPPVPVRRRAAPQRVLSLYSGSQTRDLIVMSPPTPAPSPRPPAPAATPAPAPAPAALAPVIPLALAEMPRASHDKRPTDGGMKPRRNARAAPHEPMPQRGTLEHMTSLEPFLCTLAGEALERAAAEERKRLMQGKRPPETARHPHDSHDIFGAGLQPEAAVLFDAAATTSDNYSNLAAYHQQVPLVPLARRGAPSAPDDDGEGVTAAGLFPSKKAAAWPSSPRHECVDRGIINPSGARHARMAT